MAAERWHTGENLVGDARARATCFYRWRPAANFLIDRMREYADMDDDFARAGVTLDSPHGFATEEEWVNSDDYPNMRAVVDSILRDDPPMEEKDFSAEVEDSDGWRIEFWLAKVACEHTDSRE